MPERSWGVQDWMELCSWLQFELVARALLAGCGGGDGGAADAAAAAAFAATPGATPLGLAAAVRHALGETVSTAVGEELEGAAAKELPAFAVAAGVHQLRLAGHTDPVCRDISLYWRHNRVAAGTLRSGDAAPNVELFEARAAAAGVGAPGLVATTLHALVRAAAPRPLVVVGGSYS